MQSCCRPVVVILFLAGLVMASSGAVGTAQASTPGKMATQAPPVQGPDDYVGTETCLSCHEQKADSVKVGPHATAYNPKAPANGQGCESCHGPGKAHAEAGGEKSKIRSLAAGDDGETCTSCHDRQAHALWAGSQHDTQDVGCSSCHSTHAPKSATAGLKAKSESELCATCHRAIVNKQSRFNHMPVREGKMTCATCHNVHGSANQKLLKAGATIEQSCVSCHAEKRGPYLWEHAPVVENCVTCHDPHGSNNDRMLVAKQPFLCQRCHVTSRHPPTVYEGYLLNSSQNANKIYGRSCLVCHQMVHGSNSPNGKMFLR